MDLQLQGRVIQILEEQSGQGKNGTWRKRDFILEILEIIILTKKTHYNLMKF
jgi:hypothetical protein